MEVITKNNESCKLKLAEIFLLMISKKNLLNINLHCGLIICHFLTCFFSESTRVN